MATPVFVNARFMTQPLTGVQRYAREVITRFPPQAVTLITPAPPRHEYAELAERRPLVRAANLGLRGHLWEQFVLSGRVPRAAVLFSPGNCGPLACRHQVLTVHDLAWLDHPRWYAPAFRLLYRTLVPRVARRARCVLTVSQFTRRRLIDAFQLDPERVVVTHPGVDRCFSECPDPAGAARLEKLGVAPPFVLAIGTASPRKNIAHLYDVWQQLALRGTRIPLVVAGLQQAAFAAKQRSAADNNTDIRHLGEVDEPTLVALYRAARAFVYPSLYEGFGMPPLEAMACGTPAVTSNATAVPEAVGDAALSVAPDDTAGWVAALERILTDEPLRTDLRQRGLQRAAMFTWEKAAAQTWDVLQQSR
jgi:glycosyltransferase involved in cell wall biosynthesis